MANTRSSRHGKRRRQACGLDLSPREVRHEDRHESSSCAAAAECDLVIGELRLFLNTCMQWHRERNHMYITCNQTGQCDYECRHIAPRGYNCGAV